MPSGGNIFLCHLHHHVSVFIMSYSLGGARELVQADRENQGHRMSEGVRCRPWGTAANDVQDF